MADDNLLPVLLLAGGAYLLYRYTVPAPAAPSAPPGPPLNLTFGPTKCPDPCPPPGAAPGYACSQLMVAGCPDPSGYAFGKTPAKAGAGSLDQIYLRLQGSVASGVASSDPAITVSQGTYNASPQTFNSYLVRSGGVDVSGALSTLFPSQVTVSLPQFWAAASGWLAKNQGLSGMGFYGPFFRARRV